MLSFLVFIFRVILLVLLVFASSVSGSCGVPESRNNAEPIGLNEALEVYPANSEVRFTCERGYSKLRSEDSGISKCLQVQNDEKRYEWSVPDIECVPLQCEPPSKPNNGESVGTDYTLGKTVTFRCNHGYEMYDEDGRIEESPTLLCISEKWVGTVPMCKPVQCPAPEPVEHASKAVTRSTYGGRVTYTCLEGFLFDGGDLERTCQASGKWSGEKPRCKDVKCINPDTDEFKKSNNIKSVEVSVGLEPGDEATFYCDPDKYFVATCSSEGEWVYQETCIEVTPGTATTATTATTPSTPRPIAEITPSTGIVITASTVSVTTPGNNWAPEGFTEGTLSSESAFSPSGTDSPSSDSFSVHYIVGIAVGVTLIVVIAIALGIFIHRRAKEEKSSSNSFRGKSTSFQDVIRSPDAVSHGYNLVSDKVHNP